MAQPHPDSAVAIVGMGCRLPGADAPGQFWRNLRDGVESIRRLSADELLAAGASPADLGNPKHVPAAALVDMERFDAAFFGIPAREAELMDPQHRLFLECAWEALEDAGYDPGRYDGAISVFGGGIFDSYVTWNLLPAGVFDDKAGILQTVLANEKDYMTARVAYKLNLRGAACNVQTGCSTSLVAVHMACQSLLNFESDIALAGGVAVDVARRHGYFFHEGSVYSPDGHCRAFDADAAGTVFGNGAGIVALKRLEDAIEHGDAIRAVILGTAINNDGTLKVGFTAPSVTGQSQVIVEALAAAGVGAESIGYVEAHGTGTALGDPIEIQAMAKAFEAARRKPGSCLIGSVKTNIGHLDAAAGVTGLMKTVLALEHRLIPPTLHYRRPNPELQLHRTPFRIAADATPWAAGAAPGVPRRAGVSSFGIGGTNAHAIIEEAPAVPPSSPSRPAQMLTLSARSAAALDAASSRLVEHLRGTPDSNLADAAFTLHTGRAVFPHRRSVACRTAAEAADLLESGERVATHRFDGQPARIAFMFTGQGAQYAGMARALYQSEPVFRREIDACAAALGSEIDLLALLTADRDGASLTPTALAQPALFAVGYALAQLWRHWGVDADAAIGHSLGEWVAAALSGVVSAADGIRLVAARGRLMQDMPAGSMTAVPLPADTLRFESGSALSIAAINGPALVVVSGPTDQIERFEAGQREAGVACRRLHTSHAFHSASMDPVLDAFAAAVSRVALRAPQRRFISNVTGTWITDQQATSPAYWAQQLRAPVMFAAGVQTLVDAGFDFLLEVGPGRTLATLARAQAPDVAVAASLPGAQDPLSDHEVLLDALGRVWGRGAEIDWTAFYAGERRRRVPLPTYPFERQRHWIEPDEEEVERKRARVRANEKSPFPSEWLYVRCWTQTTPSGWGTAAPGAASGSCVVIADGSPISAQIVGALRARIGADRLIVAPDVSDSLFASLPAHDAAPRILHLGSAGRADAAHDERLLLENGFFALGRLAASLSRVGPAAAIVKVVTAGVDSVTGAEPIVPARATMSAACLVLPQEQPNVACQRVDIAPGSETLSHADLEALVTELLSDAPDPQVAIRGGRRWIPDVERLKGEPAYQHALRPGGHYVIVGGFGTIGVSIGCYLAKVVQARVSLVSRTALPPENEWNRWLETHPAHDPTTVRIQRARLLTQMGGVVASLAADAADARQLQQAFEAAEQRFGPIHGVVFAAGLMDDTGFAPLAALDREAVQAHFRPKTEGLRALDRALGSRRPDFCLVASSLSVVLGGVGYAAYAAANAYVDAYVQARNQAEASGWSVVNWDAWQPFGGELPKTSLLARLAMTPTQGVTVFDWLMRARGLGQVFVSTSDLAARIREHTEPKPVAPRPAASDAAASASPAAPAAIVDDGLTPTERRVLAIWESVLGISGVQIYDSFLDLGGSSLTAIQVIGRIEEQTGIRVTIEEFIFQTASQLAALVDSRQGHTAGVATVRA
ncbi:MAG TPA: SDR family oxidoreductase [Vicinamibacterales bacterium]|nr:SDR family oxidoreductase [Vicinamibacterales bacterium]